VTIRAVAGMLLVLAFGIAAASCSDDDLPLMVLSRSELGDMTAGLQFSGADSGLSSNEEAA